MTKQKIIFLDFDGPMFPEKGDLPPFKNGVSRMDPYAVQFINKLLEDTDVKLVISSSHSTSGFEHCKNLLMWNDIDPSSIHQDWTTPKKMTSNRFTEISWWLQNHPEIDTYVVIDDLPMPRDHIKYSVRCDAYNGLTYGNFLECRYYLGILHGNEDLESLRRRAEYHKIREAFNVLPVRAYSAVEAAFEGIGRKDDETDSMP